MTQEKAELAASQGMGWIQGSSRTVDRDKGIGNTTAQLKSFVRRRSRSDCKLRRPSAMRWITTSLGKTW